VRSGAGERHFDDDDHGATMTDSTFNRSAAMDLSGFKQGGTAPGRAGARNTWVVSVDETNLEETVRRSMQYPVVLELTSARAQGADQLSADLTGLANAAEGRWLLARVDCDAHPQIAAALQVQAVPTVIGLLAGQAVPLFQGVVGHDDVVKMVDQLLQAALANGIAGRAEPVVVEADDAAQPARDPKYAVADEAMSAGDFPAAEEAFAALLKANPADTEARIGKAQAGLWARAGKLKAAEVQARLAADPKDPAAVLDAADLDLVQGRPDAAFSGVIGLIRTTFGEDREPLRERLLELFETLDPAEPAVAKARRDLASALF